MLFQLVVATCPFRAVATLLRGDIVAIQRIKLERCVTAGYVKCRVWTKLRGDTLRIEAMGRTIAKHKLVP